MYCIIFGFGLSIFLKISDNLLNKYSNNSLFKSIWKLNSCINLNIEFCNSSFDEGLNIISNKIKYIDFPFISEKNSINSRFSINFFVNLFILEIKISCGIFGKKSGDIDLFSPNIVWLFYWKSL